MSRREFERDERDRRARAEYGRCPECDAPLPNPWTDRCRHRRACEARVMLRNGVSSAEAAAHAQRLPKPDVEGVRTRVAEQANENGEQA